MRDALGRDFRAAGEGVPAGDGVVVGDDGTRCFVKLAPVAEAARLRAEVDGLEAIAASGAVRVPRVVGLGGHGGDAWLVLEALELAPLDRTSAAALGAALARLHAVSGAAFGWPRDNFIGRTPQANGCDDDWARFFATRRLAPQVAAAQAAGHAEVAALGRRVTARLPALLAGHRPRPSLLHGDLWAGNAAALPCGRPCVYDPAVHFGDRECDLAMSELFGGFPDAFLAAYARAWPLADGYPLRRDLYQLYHVLNHLNLFGAGYAGRAIALERRLLAAAG